MMRTDPAFIAGILSQIPVPTYAMRGNHVVFLLATDISNTLHGGTTAGVNLSLLGAGYRLACLDLPSHGEDAHETEIPLVNWRTRIEGGDTTLFTNFAARLSRVIDTLRTTDVSIVGQSRGGYVAAICAALEPRVKRIVMLAPVTDLQRLSEFDGYTVNQSIFGLGQYTSVLSTKDIYIRIGNNDTRVGTDAAEDFADDVGAEIEVVDEPGHGVTDDGEVAAWLTSKVDP